MIKILLLLLMMTLNVTKETKTNILKEEKNKFNTQAKEIIIDSRFKCNLKEAKLTNLLEHIDSLCVHYNVEYNYVIAIISNESR